MELLTKAQQVAKAQTKRFPNGNDPYKIGRHILEEAGETIQQLNHYERWRVSVGENSKEGKENLKVCKFDNVFWTLHGRRNM